MVGAQYGALLTTRVKPDLLRLALAIIILIVALRMFIGLVLAPRRDFLDRISVSARPALLLFAAASPLLLAAQKPMLVPDISARQVQIRYSFSGAQLLLFGAIVYPGGRPPSEPADVVVVLRGPVQPILVREKQKIAGIWMNADSNRFRSAPSFMPSPRRDRSPTWSMSAPRRSTSLGSRTCSCRRAAAPCPRRSGGSRPA